ncbi:MAG TPA: SIS domain-containing protein, partial [Anaerolineaceae bacterium]|nr:SIS domain-containing protein [Anaerolineaceae bacterium]
MDYHTYNEIKTQTEAWKEAIAVTVEQAEEIRKLTDRYEQVIFTGCGSTYYLSLAGSALFQSLTNKSARAVPASELLFNTPSVIARGSRNLLVAVSRSGTTTETLRAVEMFKREQLGEVIVISNYDTSMSPLADLKIVIPAGQEKSVAQTRSFASMYV